MMRRVLAAPAVFTAGAALLLSLSCIMDGADAFSPTLGVHGGFTARRAGVPSLRVASQAGPARLGLQKRQRRHPGGAVMMADEDEGEKKAIFSKSIGQSIGQTLRNLDDEVKADDGEEEEKTGKQALFGDREKRMQEAIARDLEDEDEEGGMVETGPPNPNPINFYPSDFEKSVWKIQVEKNSNWFSGNYVPNELMMAFTDEETGKVEFAGDSLTGGRWYASGNSVYFERQPFKVLGPLGPGVQYFRGSLEGWCSDDMKLQCAGYVSGYSPLFPTAVLGRFLMTREKAITQEEKEKRLKRTQRELRGDASSLLLAKYDDEDGEEEGGSAPKPKKVVDLSDDLTEEQMLRKEAAEWVPSSIESQSATRMDGLTKSLERLAGTVEETARRNFSQDDDK